MASLVVVLTEPITSRAAMPPGIVRDLTRQAFNLRYQIALPSGYQACTFSVLMSRIEAMEWYERFLLWGITVYEADEIMWDGRIASIKLTEFGVDITCEGYWASLADQTLYSWWADNDMQKWLQPAAGAGQTSDEITLTGAGAIDKFAMSAGAGLFTIGLVPGTAYTANDRGTFYYRLPRVSNLNDKRVFAPMTIHHIAFELEWAKSGTPVVFMIGELHWADHALGTWTFDTELFNANTMLSGVGNGTVGYNLASSGVSAEAVALSVRASNTGTAAQEGNVAKYKNVTIFASADPISVEANKLYPKRIIKALLNGDNDLGEAGPPQAGIRYTHGAQVSAQTTLIEDSSQEILPAIFENQTMQDIITRITGFGLAQTKNIITNPQFEVGINGATATGPTLSHDATQFKFGTKSLKAVGSASASDRVDFRKTDGTTRFSVEAGKDYTYSSHLLATGANPSVVLGIDWYNAGGTLISSAESSTPFFINDGDSWRRVYVTDRAPEGAVTALLCIKETILWSTSANLFVDGQQFEQSSYMTPYCDGTQPGGVWEGVEHQSPSGFVYPVLAGIFGRNVLQIKSRRIEQTRRWVVGAREMVSSGIEFERSIQEFWGRVWVQFQAAYTGLTKFTNMVDNSLERAIIYDERDRVFSAGEVTENFAELLAGIYREDHKRPRQRTSVVLKGKIRNMAGVAEPVHRVRAGDALLFEDISPMSPIPLQPDALRLFIIKETEYNASNGELTIIPDFPPQTADLVMAGLEISAPFGVGNVTGN